VLQTTFLRTLAGLVLLLTVFGGSLKAQSSPVVISNYQSGTDGSYASVSSAGLASPSLVVSPKVPFRGGNNCAVMAVTSNSAYTQGTPTDNTGETWHGGPSVSDNGYTLKIWYVLGDAAGTSRITVPMAGTPTSPLNSLAGAWVTEVENCNISSIGGTGTLDTTATGSALTLSLSAVPTSGDMVWAAFIDTAIDVNNESPTPFDTSISPGSGFTLLSKSLSFGKLAEYSTSTTSTSVQATYSGNNTVLGAALVVKQGSAGTGPPSGAYIDHYQVEQFNGNNQVFFPCSGNLIVGLVNGGGAYQVSSVSGSTGTWVEPSSAIATNSGAIDQIIYAYGASCASTTNLTPKWSSTPAYPGTEIAFASVTNAVNTSSVFDSGHATVGSQTTAGNLTADSITPNGMNELVFNMTGIALHSFTNTVTDANGHTPTWLAAVNPKDDDTGSNCSASTQPSSLDEDNGYAVYINSNDTKAVTFIYTGTQTTGPCASNPAGVGGWWSASAAFKTVGAVKPPNPPTDLTSTVQ
jgi:hypothetical protein